MGDVIAFRPTDEDRKILARTKAAMGFKTDAETLRHLVRTAGKEERTFAASPLMRYRVPKDHRGGKSMTSKEIDDLVYGDR